MARDEDEAEKIIMQETPQRGPFSRLPHELLIYVAKQLNVADLRSLRLTSRYTSSILRVLLAREEFVGVPWRDNAARLDALSRWPECAQQIRSVRICSRPVYEDEEQMAWSESQGGGSGGYLEPELCPMSDWHRTARRLAAHPEERRLVPLKADMLTEALCRLKGLQELELTWERYPFVCRADVLGFDLVGDADDNDELAEQLEYTTAGWQVEMLVDLATDMQPLRALTLAPFALEAMDQASYLPLISNLFNSLVRLDLQFTARAGRADMALLSKLEDLLEAAWVLRELRIDFDSCGRGNNTEEEEQAARRQLLDFLPKTHIPRLQSLTLVRCVVSRLGDLGELLRRHAGTLTSLELREMRGGVVATTTTWEDLFHGMRHNLPKLATAVLRGTFTDHVATLRFKVIGEEELWDVMEEEDPCEDIYDAPGPSQPVGGPGVEDPAPLERYLLRLGGFPKLRWTRV